MASVAEELNPPDLLSSVSAMNLSPDSEDNQEKDELASDLNEKDASLLYKINNLHCPFIWKPEDSLNSYNSDSVEEIMNVDEMVEDASGFKLRKFVIHLILCYNNFCKRLLEKSLKNLDEMEKMLLVSMKNRSQDIYFTQINDALFHILHSCRVVMLHSTNQKEKAAQVLQKVTPYDALNPTNQAGIWAVRANLYVEFGYEGIKAAIQYIERATKIDDDNPYWHFTKGMYLGRLRRMESGLAIPSMEEIASLELSMKLKEDAAFMAFAAEVYVETANRSKNKSQQLLLHASEHEIRKLTAKNDMINERAAMLFKKSVSLNSKCAHLLFRCGKGMLKLAPPHQDLQLARKYLEEGLEIAYESSFGNHAMALYYMKHEEDYNKAKKYLIKASESKNFGADIDLIRVNFLINQNPNELLESLLKLFDRYNDKMKHRKILAEIESYYLFINYNLIKAIDYMNKLLYLIGDHDDIISTFKSGILRQKFPVSLLEILLSDIADRSNKGTLSTEEQEECRKFMQRLCFQNVNLPWPKNENLRKTFIKDIKSNFKEVNVRKEKSSSSRTVEKPMREDYNPVECRFDKEYAKKYYEDDQSSKPQKTVVDEFFEKYEAALEFKSKKVESTESGKEYSKKSSNNAETKSEDSSECHPVLQRLFTKMKESSKEKYSSDESDENEDEEGIINKIARRLDLHLSVSARSEISKKIKRSKNINDGASTSHQRDQFNAPDDYRRRSSCSPAKRSRSRDSHRTGKEPSRKRPDSRESYRSTESYRKRSPSTESRYSTRHSHRRRSPSRESRHRSRSRDERRSQNNRSLSRESYLSTKGRKALTKRSKSKEDYKSSRRRSRSYENKYAVKTTRKRSSSGESESTSGAERLSRKELSESKARRKRSESRESIRSPKESIRKRRSPSREKYTSSRQKPASEKRSMSRDCYRSSKTENSRRERSISKENYRSTRDSRRKRSVSGESLRSSEIVNPGRERSISKESHRKRSSSKESHSSKVPRERSISKESHPSNKKSRQKRSISRESHWVSKEEPPCKERSISNESRRSSRKSRRKRSSSRESCQSSKVKNFQKERSISKESHRLNKEPHQKRSISRESRRSSKTEPPCRERSVSKESQRSSKQSYRKRSTSPESRKLIKSSSKKQRDRHSSVDYSDPKTISGNSDDSADSIDRSRGRKKRRSPARSDKSKRYESDETLTESTDSDIEDRRYMSSKKFHRSDRYRSDNRDHRRRGRHRSYSSDETRSIRSGRSSSKESRRSKKVRSRDRRHNHGRKHFDSPYEESSSDNSSKSPRRKVDRVPKSSHQRSSDSDNDFSVKADRKKNDKQSEKQETGDKGLPQQLDDDIKNNE